MCYTKSRIENIYVNILGMGFTCKSIEEEMSRLNPVAPPCVCVCVKTQIQCGLTMDME